MATQYKKFVINPNSVWANTGLNITSGQRLTVIAKGRVNLWPSDNPERWASPEGAPYGTGVTGLALPAALIGKINNTIFKVGHAFDGYATDSGALQLMINDNNPGDNRGSFKIRIVIDAPGVLSSVSCPFGNGSPANPTTGNPIKLYDGDKVLNFTDMDVVTPAGKLSFERSYDQAKQADSNYQFMGLGWSHNHVLNLVISGTAAQIFFPNGGVLTLNDLGSTGHFTPQPGSSSVLDVSGLNYVLTAEDKSQYIFEPSGISGNYRLLTRKWPSSEQWNYIYVSNKLDEVNDNYNGGNGRKLKFVYRPTGFFDAGQLWRVGDQTSATTLSNPTPSGHYIQFSYTTEKLAGNDTTPVKALLTGFKDVHTKDWLYSYYGQIGTEADPAKRSFLQTRVSPSVDTDGDGIDNTSLTLEQLNYTLSGSAITAIDQQRGNGLLDTHLAFEKDPSIGKNQTTESINNLLVSFSKTHFFANGVYLGTGIDDADNSPFDIQVLDQNYRPMGQVDGVGNDTQLQWANSNATNLPGALLTTVTDANGNQTLFDYNADDTLKTSTDTDGRKALYVYDPNRRSPTLIIVANSASELAINGDMETSAGWSTVSGATNSLVTSPVDSGLNARQVTATALNSGVEKNPGITLQANTTYVISARVRPATGQVKMQLVNGATVLKSTLSDTTPAKMNTWQTLRLVYTTSSIISGSKLQFLANVASTSFYVDSVHMLETVNFQRWQEFIYDDKLRPLFERVITPATGAVQQETERIYGTTGNDAGLVQQMIQRDPLAISNNFAYTYTYDSAGRIVTTQKQSIFGSCQFSHTVYDAAGLVLATVCGPTGTTPTSVTAARDMYVTDNQNKVTTYDYDSMGRQVKVTINDGTGSTNKQTALTVYDALNRVVRTIANYINQAAQYTAPTTWVWDTNLKVWKDGNGQTVSHGTDPVAGTLNTQNVINITEYNKIGAVRKQTDVLGNVTLLGYDSAGRAVKTIRNASQTGYNNDFAGASPNVADPDLSDYVASAAPDQDIITETTYDANGNPVKSLDPLGNATFTVYDALKRPVRTIRNAKTSARIDLYDNDSLYSLGNDPTSPLYMPGTAADQDQIERTEYDAMGRVVRQIDVLGKVTYITYDDQSRVSKTIHNYVPQTTTNPQNWFWYEDAVPTLRWQRSSSDTTLIDHGVTNDQNIISYTAYDPEGRVLYTQDPLGRRTWIKYDGLGRAVKTIANAAALPTVTLGSANDPRSDTYVPSTQSDKDRISITTYDSQGRVQWTQDPNGRKNWNVYDSQGRVVKSIANCTYVSGSPAPEDPTYIGSSNADDDIISKTEYDIWGRVSKTIDPLGHETRYSYDLLGRRTTTIMNYVDGIYNPASPDVDLIQTTEYDVAGRITKTTDARGTQTVFAYDLAGRRLTVTQAANSPLASTTYTVYDKASRTLRNIVGYTPLYLQNGAVVYQPVNNANFPSTLILPYTKTNGLWDFVPPHNSEANDRNLITEFVYDKAGRQVSSIDPLGNSAQAAYSKDGTVEALIDPEGVVTKYRYDKLNRRTRVIQNYNQVQIQPKIAFVGTPGTTPQIHVMNVDGTLRTNLSNNAFIENDPSWSPDGSKLIYRSNRAAGTYLDLYSMKADGTAVQRLTTLSGGIDSAVWSPDGRQIAFAFFPSGGSAYQVYVMNANGTNPRQITASATGVVGINWSPDGQRLVISANGGNNIYTLQADGTDLADLQHPGINPVWSSDGSRIAYAYNGDLFVVNTDGSTPIQLTNIPNNPGNGFNPAWSPDSTKLVFYSNRDGDDEIFTVNGDGSGSLLKLTTNTVSDIDPTWSPQVVDPLFWIWSTTNSRWEYGNANAIPHGTDNDQNIIVDVTYDKVGRVLTQRDPRGNAMAYTCDLLDRRKSLTNPLSKVWSTTYTDLAGGKTRATMTYPGITGSANYQVLRDFDRTGRLSTIQYNAPAVTPDVAMTYDKLGNRLKVSEYSAANFTSRIRETNFNYDTARRLSSVGFDNTGDGVVDETVVYQYDAGGLRTKLTLPGNLNVVYSYDQHGQLVSLTDWDSQKTQFAYDQVGRHVLTERPNGLRSRHKYDPAGRLRVLHHSRDGYVSPKFPNINGLLDNFGRADGALGTNWSGTTSGYSILGTHMDVGTGGDIYWAANAFGADQEVYVTFNTIDAASTEINLLLKAQSGLWSNGVIKVMYKPATGKVQVWTYTASQGWVQRGSDISVTFANLDTFGARALASGEVQVYKNNTLVGNSDISGWTLNASGGSIGLWMINSSSSVLNNFSGGTFAAAISTTVAHFEYQVDKRGNQTQALEQLLNRQQGSGSVVYATDKGLLLSDNWLDVGGYKENSQFNASLKLIFMGDEATLSMGQGPDHSIYDVYIDSSLWQSFDGYAASASQHDIVISLGVDNRKLQSEGPHILELRNQPEKNRNATGMKIRFKQLAVANKTWTQQAISYSYDKLARLKEVRYNPGLNMAAADADLLRRYLYTYDRTGNRTQQSVAIGAGVPTVTNYSYNAANQISISGFTYDNNGNLTNDGAHAYTWDRANRIIDMGGTFGYVYNGLGNIVKHTGASNFNVLLDLQSSLVTDLRLDFASGNQYFIHSPYGIHELEAVAPNQRNVWQWTLPDGLGSIRSVIDFNDPYFVWATQSYSPYGEGFDIFSPSWYSFTGESMPGTLDGIGLLNLRARHYIPAFGAFASQDFLESGNRYWYANANPINWVDKNGLQTIAQRTPGGEASYGPGVGGGGDIIGSALDLLFGGIIGGVIRGINNFISSGFQSPTGAYGSYNPYSTPADIAAGTYSFGNRQPPQIDNAMLEYLSSITDAQDIQKFQKELAQICNSGVCPEALDMLRQLITHEAIPSADATTKTDTAEKVKERTGRKDIALGLQLEGNLFRFAVNLNIVFNPIATVYPFADAPGSFTLDGSGGLIEYDLQGWVTGGLTKFNPRNPSQLLSATNDALNNAAIIHFNLEGIRGDYVKFANSSQGGTSNGFTALELWNIKNNPDLCRKTVFYKQGSKFPPIPAPDAHLQICGV